MYLEYFGKTFYIKLIDYPFPVMYELVSIYFILSKIIKVLILRQFSFILLTLEILKKQQLLQLRILILYSTLLDIIYIHI